jgi:hypothetical protein
MDSLNRKVKATVKARSTKRLGIYLAMLSDQQKKRHYNKETLCWPLRSKV